MGPDSDHLCTSTLLSTQHRSRRRYHRRPECRQGGTDPRNRSIRWRRSSHYRRTAAHTRALPSKLHSGHKPHRLRHQCRMHQRSSQCGRPRRANIHHTLQARGPDPCYSCSAAVLQESRAPHEYHHCYYSSPSLPLWCRLNIQGRPANSAKSTPSGVPKPYASHSPKDHQAPHI